MRAVAHARILRGAMAALAEHGLDVTIDEIAEAAGVSRRTVFRHFSSHDQVLEAAAQEIIRIYSAALPPSKPIEPDGLHAWLSHLAGIMFDLNTRVLGRAFWDIHLPAEGRDPELTQAIDYGLGLRKKWARECVIEAWTAAHGRGDPPDWLVDAFLVLMTAFTTNALISIGYRTREESMAMTVKLLEAVLESSVRESGPDHPGRRARQSRAEKKTAHPPER